ncbi:SDR family oxidoreductase [Peijinzhouia sedimentorum]
MKILLTGATGYIGKRLLPILLKEGHTVYCAVRDKNRFTLPELNPENVKVLELDFLDSDTLKDIPEDLDVAYYLIHSLSAGQGDFHEMEAITAQNFVDATSTIKLKQVIFLSGIVNADELSKHLGSRKNVEDILAGGNYEFTTFRAGIIVGSGSASFEIIRDLVEKLPVMIAPKWLLTKSHPIAIRDVLQFLTKAKLREDLYNQSFDIAGPDVLNYREMLLRFAKIRGLKRWIGTVPVMTPKLSSYWLYFVTSTSFTLAQNLVDSMKVEVIAKPSNINQLLDITPMTYEEAIENAFQRIEQNQIISSWKDSMISGIFNEKLSTYIQVPKFGCFVDQRKVKIENKEEVLNNIWSLGGENGWYAKSLWKIRGYLDKVVGGVGLRRGRTSPTTLHPGDSLDFWRVLLADRNEGRLLLFAEMKLPGEAWLEFKVDQDNILWQTATFRPKGLFGRLYWYAVLPFHGIVFSGMIRSLAKPKVND